MDINLDRSNIVKPNSDFPLNTISPSNSALLYSGIIPLITFSKLLFPIPECPVMTVTSPGLKIIFIFFNMLSPSKLTVKFCNSSIFSPYIQIDYPYHY